MVETDINAIGCRNVFEKTYLFVTEQNTIISIDEKINFE